MPREVVSLLSQKFCSIPAEVLKILTWSGWVEWEGPYKTESYSQSLNAEIRKSESWSKITETEKEPYIKGTFCQSFTLSS